VGNHWVTGGQRYRKALTLSRFFRIIWDYIFAMNPHEANRRESDTLQTLGVLRPRLRSVSFQLVGEE